MVYLFTGSEVFEKDAKIREIRSANLAKDTEQFNFDILHAKNLLLKNLQEKLLCLPINSPKRIVVLKNAEDLKKEHKEFILNYIKKPYKNVIFILDMDEPDKRDDFFKEISRLAKVVPFKENPRLDAFTLNRSIQAGRPDYALKILNQLLEKGDRPELILGGLRYAWEKDAMLPQEAKKKLKLLLNCDIEIKTGRLRPVFALEKLVISLCSFSKPLH